MEYTEWIEQFKPIMADGEPLRHDTYVPEQKEALLNALENTIWTMVEDSDSDTWYLTNGVHLVNRVGYYITTVPYNPTKIYNIEYA